MKKSSTVVRLGRLSLLGLFAAFVVWKVWITGSNPEGGGAIAVMGVLALALIYIGSGIEWLTTRRRRKER
jgi:hypothetical protein